MKLNILLTVTALAASASAQGDYKLTYCETICNQREDLCQTCHDAFQDVSVAWDTDLRESARNLAPIFNSVSIWGKDYQKEIQRQQEEAQRQAQEAAAEAQRQAEEAAAEAQRQAEEAAAEAQRQAEEAAAEAQRQAQEEAQEAAEKAQREAEEAAQEQFNESLDELLENVDTDNLQEQLKTEITKQIEDPENQQFLKDQVCSIAVDQMDQQDLENKLKDFAYDQLMAQASNAPDDTPVSKYLAQMQELASQNPETEQYVKDYLWDQATQGMTEEEIYDWICQMVLDQSQQAIEDGTAQDLINKAVDENF